MLQKPPTVAKTTIPKHRIKQMTALKNRAVIFMQNTAADSRPRLILILLLPNPMLYQLLSELLFSSLLLSELLLSSLLLSELSSAA